MANTTADKAEMPVDGMSHSEVHYFNSYNHHGIHEEMLVGQSCMPLGLGERLVADLVAERRSEDEVIP